LLVGIRTLCDSGDCLERELSNIRELYHSYVILGGIDLEELNVGFRRLGLPQPIRLSGDDFMDITQRGKLLNDAKELSPSAFEHMMLTQFRKYAQRKTVHALAKLPENESEILFAIKMLASQVCEHTVCHRQSPLVTRWGERDSTCWLHAGFAGRANGAAERRVPERHETHQLRHPLQSRR